MKATVIALLVIAALVLSFTYAPVQVPARGVYWDESMYEAHTVSSDSVAVCRLLPDGSIGCLPLPAGSVILVPRPGAFD